MHYPTISGIKVDLGTFQLRVYLQRSGRPSALPFPYFFVCPQVEGDTPATQRLVATSPLFAGSARSAEAALRAVVAEWPVDHWYGKVLDALCKVRLGIVLHSVASRTAYVALHNRR